MKKLVCLLLAFVFVVGTFSGCNVPNEPTSGTQNIQVPTTTIAPSTPTLPRTQIRLQRLMEIWYNTVTTHLFCTYFTSNDEFYPGQTITITVTLENAGGAIAYTGALEDQFGSAQLRADHSEYTIASEERPISGDTTQRQLAHLETAKYIYTFVVPQDAPEDHYTLEITAFGELIRFDSEAELEKRYVPCLADLSEEAQKIIARLDYGVESQYFSYARTSKYIPVYGEFGDTYVAFWQHWGDCVFTYETVNGLTFTYGSTAHIDVFTPYGIYTLTEAFESGLLNAEQLQQVYDNYQSIGSIIPEHRYEPYMQVTDPIQITHWEEMRLRYSCSVRYNRYYAGDQIEVWVTITNMGPEASFYSIKDDISATAWLISDETGHVIESTELSQYLIDHRGDAWITGLGVNFYYTFTVPEDFQEGTYTFVFKMGEREIRFNAEAAAEERNITILGKIPVRYTIFGKETQSGKFPDHMPVYGWFDNTYVYIYPTASTDGVPTIETVNGLEFEVPDGYQLHVFSNEHGAFTLQEAFDAGILTAEQLQEVYDNYIFLQNSSTTIKP